MKKYKYIRLENIEKFEGWDLVHIIPRISAEHYQMCVICSDDTLQKDAEIERLTKLNEEFYNTIKENAQTALEVTLDEIEKAKVEAIKEFVDRVASKLNCIPQHHFTLAQVLYDIDNIKTEMVGEDSERM